MCYDTAKWDDARDAIIKGSISVPKYCVEGLAGDQGASWMTSPSDYDIPDLPKEILLPSGETIDVAADSLTYDFNLDEGVHCYL